MRKIKEFLLRPKVKKKFLSFIIFILVCVIAYNCYVLIKWHNNGNDIKDINKEIEEVIKKEEVIEETEVVNEKKDEYFNFLDLPLQKVDLTELINTNKDTVGFISVSGTNINYPVVQSSDNDYYLKHSFKGKYNDAGWIFVDYRNDMNNLDKNTIIYGHARLDGVLFGTLKNVLKNGWLNDSNNYIVNFNTMNESTLWQVFSIYTIASESYYIQNSFNNDNEYQEWLKMMLSRSQYDFKTSVDINDKVLTLSTCYDTNGTRIVMQAKLIKKANY